MELVEGIATVEDVDEFVTELGEIAAEFGATVQAFDARYVVSARHLERALELADRERERGDAIARDRAVEVLLYAAGRRQITRALELGVDEGETPVVVLVDGEPSSGSKRAGGRRGGETASNETAKPSRGPRDEGDESGASDAVADLLAPAETLGAYDEARVREFFDAGDAELAATDATLEDLVLERVALLVVER